MKGTAAKKLVHTFPILSLRRLLGPKLRATKNKLFLQKFVKETKSATMNIFRFFLFSF